MTRRSLVAEFIRAIAHGDRTTSDSLSDEMERTGTTSEYVGAIFYVLASRRFRSAVAHGEIIRFVAALRMELDHTGDEIDPDAAERMLHVAVDTDPADPRLEPNVTVELELLLIRWLLKDVTLSDDQLSDVFGEAGAYLDQLALPDEFQRAVERIVAAQRTWDD